MVSLSTEAYLAKLDTRQAELEQLPFEHHRRGIGHDRLRRRLAAERDALLSCATQAGEPPTVYLLICAGPIERTSACWDLQSHPSAVVLQFASADDGSDQAAGGHPHPAPFCQTRTIRSLADLDPQDWLIVAMGGEFHHPALACALALRSLDAPMAKAWSWNSVQLPDPADNSRAARTCPLIRRPGCQRDTLLSADYVGRAIAIRAGWLANAPRDVQTAWQSGNCGPAALELATTVPDLWQHHPEFLSLDLIRAWRPWSSDPGAIERIRALSWRIAPTGWRDVERPSEDQALVEPVSVPSKTSVVIPFRGNIDATLLAIVAISRQRIAAGEIELILVDNGSRPEEIEVLESGLKSLSASVHWRIIAYPHGFNHSRQCNLGVRAASGEVVIILNNDATMLGVDVIDQLTRWASLPGVATVGAQVVDQHGALVCAGIRARLRAGLDHDSAFEESKDPLLANGLRIVAGNTGACFAIRRDRFLELGGFDERLFPIGYNDVEFACRAIQAGYRHLNIGWVQVRHEPGASRGSADEIMQKVMLRDRFPSAFRHAQFQLGYDTPLVTGRGSAPVPHRSPSRRATSVSNRLKSRLKRMLNG